MSNKIATIIPFYQEKTGLLRNAVASALEQKGVDPFKIIVVDDGSPVRAQNELLDLQERHSDRIVIIEQDNAGPGAARNTGLNNVPFDTTYVAFLDSDDQWMDTHLAKALSVLEMGYDLYFSDYRRPLGNVTSFEEKKFEAGCHQILNRYDLQYTHKGNFFDDMLYRNPVGTPTAVYRYSIMPDLRFDPAFRSAAEDYLFFLEIAQRTRRIAFSERCEVNIGEGVNIFYSKGWGTPGALCKLCDDARFRRLLQQKFSLSRTQRALNNRIIRRIRREFMRNFLKILQCRDRSAFLYMRRYMSIDRAMVLEVYPLAASLLIGITLSKTFRSFQHIMNLLSH